MIWSARTACRSGGYSSEGSLASPGWTATSVKFTKSRSWSSAMRSASSGAAASLFGESDAVTVGKEHGSERLRGGVDNAVVLGTPPGELVAVAWAVDVDADRRHGEPVEDGRRQGRIAEV